MIAAPATVYAGRFAGKVAVVAAAGHGIGRSVAVRLAREGARVAALDLRRSSLDETMQLVSQDSGDSAAWVADLADPDAVAAALAQVLERFGTIDVLHSNAGVLLPGSVELQSLDDWDRTFAVNVRSAFLLGRQVLPVMRSHGGGSIVHTASTSGLVGEAGLAAYCASKAALINLTRQMALDYARSGIRVNCVCPGWIDTGFNDPVLEGVSDEELQQMIAAQVPIGRQGTPDEVAAAVLFLLSDDASLITGHALVADGGFTAV